MVRICFPDLLPEDANLHFGDGGCYETYETLSLGGPHIQQQHTPTAR